MPSIQLPWERAMASSAPGTLLSSALCITSLADFNPFTILNHNMSKMDTPVFLPGESQGQRSLEGCRLWGHTESDTTEAT